MTEIMSAIYERRSVREFSSDPVDRNTILDLIKAAQMAPSAGNLQARDFIVVTNNAIKKKLRDAALNQDFLIQAPVVIVICASIPRSSRIYRGRGEFYSIQDATASVMVMMLAAHDKGLATCWVGAFDDMEVCRILMIPADIRPVCLLALGYPLRVPRPPGRMEVEKITHWESW